MEASDTAEAQAGLDINEFLDHINWWISPREMRALVTSAITADAEAGAADAEAGAGAEAPKKRRRR